MKYSTSQLKALIKTEKDSMPKLNASKMEMMMYCMNKKLIMVEEHIKDAEKHIHMEEVHEMESKKERELAHKDVHKAMEDLSKKYPKNKKVMKLPEHVEEKDHTKEPRKQMGHDLKEVQRIRKEKGVSLKEAWGMYLSSKKKE